MRDPMLPRIFGVRTFHEETHDTFTLDLEPERPFDFAPGQFNMLYAFGAGEVPISISGDPRRSERCIHTIRAVGPVTRLLATLRTGDQLGVRGPYGHPWPMEAARGRDLVVVAGGVGLAPLRPVVYYVLAHREEYGRLVLLYGARTPADVLFWKELDEWRAKTGMRVEVTVDTATRDWSGHVGVVPALIERAPFDGLDAVALLCGPEIMMRHAITALEQRGVSADRIYLSLERNMKCAVGFCGHCQYGGEFICKDGPVFSYRQVQVSLFRKEL